MQGRERGDELLLSDPAVAAVAVRDCGAPLLDVRSAGLRLDARQRDATGSWALVRRGLLARLEEAQALLPAGLALLVVEGYRPPALQLAYFAEYAGQQRAQHPGWSEEAIRREASRYIAPPDVAPHVAGAAVDLTLCRADGEELDLGTAVNATPEDSDGRCYTAAPGVTGAARTNRAVMGRVLGAVGLVNYPTEWWHWSFGDRYWAATTGAPVACYGPVDAVPPGG